MKNKKKDPYFKYNRSTDYDYADDPRRKGK